MPKSDGTNAKQSFPSKLPTSGGAPFKNHGGSGAPIDTVDDDHSAANKRSLNLALKRAPMSVTGKPPARRT